MHLSGVTYTTAATGYFEKRGLRRAAGLWGLWGLAVGAVVSGNYSGWNFGIEFAGFGGMLIAFAILVIMYYGMLFSIGEMASAMPHTGGAYSFARAAMGPIGGFVTGLAETIEYVATTAVIVFFSSAYADAITTDLLGVSLPNWLWWLLLYGVFIALNTAGSHVSFRFAIIVSILSVAIIAMFAVMVLIAGKFSFAALFDIVPDPGQTAFLPHGVLPILFALPFAMWLFLGIEELPLAAEEAHNPTRDIPRAGIWARGTLIATGLLVLFFNTAVLGAAATGGSQEPLLDGFRAMVPPELAAVLALLALIGLFASLQGIMFAYGRNMYSLSRAGYYPRFLSLTGKRKTPWVALLIGAGIGFVALVFVDVLGSLSPQGAGAVAGAIVLNIAVWGAVLAYLLQMVSFVLLRRKFPEMARPYRSPWGTPGALVAASISALIFVGFLLNETFQPAIFAIGVLYIVMLLIFAFYGRHRLVLSPEEEFALHASGQGERLAGVSESVAAETAAPAESSTESATEPAAAEDGRE